MLASSIGWILVASGIITAAGGFFALLFPRQLLRLAFGVELEASATFFVLHWALLIFLMGAMIVYSTYYPATRFAILLAAAIEKLAIVGLVFFGPIKRTAPMTAVAAGDGLFAVLYLAYLGGL
jgi:hypothetical protein